MMDGGDEGQVGEGEGEGFSPVRMSQRRGKGVDGASVVGLQVRMKMVRRDREGV